MEPASSSSSDTPLLAKWQTYGLAALVLASGVWCGYELLWGERHRFVEALESCSGQVLRRGGTCSFSLDDVLRGGWDEAVFAGGDESEGVYNKELSRNHGFTVGDDPYKEVVGRWKGAVFLLRNGRYRRHFTYYPPAVEAWLPEGDERIPIEPYVSVRCREQGRSHRVARTSPVLTVRTQVFRDTTEGGGVMSDGGKPPPDVHTFVDVWAEAECVAEPSRS